MYNGSEAPLTDVAVCFVLDAFGEYYFWPSWERYDSGQTAVPDHRMFTVASGLTTVTVLEPFEWPATGDAAADGLCFYGALLDRRLATVIGDMGLFVWGYGPLPNDSGSGVVGERRIAEEGN